MNRHIYREPEIGLRPTTDRWGDGSGTVVTGRAHLYNPNLTMGELSLLRHLIYETTLLEKEGVIDFDARVEILKLLHSWMFAGGGRVLEVPLDIFNTFRVGQQTEFKE